MLSAGPDRPVEPIEFKITVSALAVKRNVDNIGFENRNRGSAGVDPPAALCRRHPLNADIASLTIETIDTATGD